MVVSARHRWSEAAGFTINRPAGIENFTLLHFFGPVRLQIGDGAPEWTRPDACVLFAPHTKQWFCSETPLLHDWMHLDAGAAELVRRYGVPTETLLYPGDCSFITSAICEIELEINSSRVHRLELADAASEMLLIRLSRACAGGTEARAVNPELGALLHRFRSGLFARLGEPWTVERMAEEMHMSPSRFYAVYKAQFDVSPMNDLIQARIDAAKSVLVGSDISVARLAERLGYASVTHFSRQFRQRTGVSPRTYTHK